MSTITVAMLVWAKFFSGFFAPVMWVLRQMCRLCQQTPDVVMVGNKKKVRERHGWYTAYYGPRYENSVAVLIVFSRWHPRFWFYMMGKIDAPLWMKVVAFPGFVRNLINNRDAHTVKFIRDLE